MASELAQLLTEMAERGEWRGPDATMAAARAELDNDGSVAYPQHRSQCMGDAACKQR